MVEINCNKIIYHILHWQGIFFETLFSDLGEAFSFMIETEHSMHKMQAEGIKSAVLVYVTGTDLFGLTTCY